MYPHEIIDAMEFRLEQWLKEHKKITVSQETMRRRTKQFLKTGFERQSDMVDCDLLSSASIRLPTHAQ